MYVCVGGILIKYCKLSPAFQIFGMKRNTFL